MTVSHSPPSGNFKMPSTPRTSTPPRQLFKESSKKGKQNYVSPVVLSDTEDELDPIFQRRSGHSGSQLSMDKQRNVRRHSISHSVPHLRTMNKNYAEPAEPDISLNSATRNFLNLWNEKFGLRRSILLYLTLLVVIICFYINKDLNILNPISLDTAIFTKCDREHSADASYSCIEEHHLNSTLVLLKKISNELQTRTLSKICEQKTSISTLYCVKDIVKPSRYMLQQLMDVQNCEYLIDHNPHWGIQNVDENGIKLTMEEILHQRANHKNCFAMNKPRLPLKCLIYRKLETFYLAIGTVCILGIPGYVGYFVYTKRRKLVDNLIADIVREVHKKNNAVVVISRLKDKLIDPMDRKSLDWAWEEAINYLKYNDGRIQFEIKNINDVECKVMRWNDGQIAFNEQVNFEKITRKFHVLSIC